MHLLTQKKKAEPRVTILNELMVRLIDMIFVYQEYIHQKAHYRGKLKPLVFSFTILILKPNTKIRTERKVSATYMY